MIGVVERLGHRSGPTTVDTVDGVEEDVGVLLGEATTAEDDDGLF